MSKNESWAAYARIILERVKVDGEPALEFIERAITRDVEASEVGTGAPSADVEIGRQDHG